jgi:hypothetical protein
MRDIAEAYFRSQLIPHMAVSHHGMIREKNFSHFSPDRSIAYSNLRLLSTDAMVMSNGFAMVNQLSVHTIIGISSQRICYACETIPENGMGRQGADTDAKRRMIQKDFGRGRDAGVYLNTDGTVVGICWRKLLNRLMVSLLAYGCPRCIPVELTLRSWSSSKCPESLSLSRRRNFRVRRSSLLLSCHSEGRPI